MQCRGTPVCSPPFGCLSHEGLHARREVRQAVRGGRQEAGEWRRGSFTQAQRSELTEREPDFNRRMDKRNAEVGRERKAKGKEGGKGEKREEREEDTEEKQGKGREEKSEKHTKRRRKRVEPAADNHRRCTGRGSIDSHQHREWECKRVLSGVWLNCFRVLAYDRTQASFMLPPAVQVLCQSGGAARGAPGPGCRHHALAE